MCWLDSGSEKSKVIPWGESVDDARLAIDVKYSFRKPG